MEVKIRAQLTRTDSVNKVRRFRLPVEAECSNTDIFKTLTEKLSETFPRLLKGSPFTVAWQDANGDVFPVTSDKEFMDAVSASKSSNDVITLVVKEQNAEGKKRKPGAAKRAKDAVTMSHRRWAKAYIRYWRQENLKEVSSDSDDGTKKKERLDRDKFDVPEVYQQWLDVILPRWHKKWGGELEEHVKVQKFDNAFKESVPQEFRKWTRFYLDRHFGKKERPRLKGEAAGADGQGEENVDGGNAEGGRKKPCKQPRLRNLAQAVPAPQRQWAKAYTDAWRQKNLKSISTDTEDDPELEGRLDRAKHDVPEAYQDWLDVFLPRWHRKWGEEVEKQDKPDEVDKDSVPLEFRKWMRCYLNRNFGKKTAPELKEEHPHQS